MTDLLVWQARCRSCRHRWVALVEAGGDLTALECPSCHAQRSIVVRSNPLTLLTRPD